MDSEEIDLQAEFFEGINREERRQQKADKAKAKADKGDKGDKAKNKGDQADKGDKAKDKAKGGAKTKDKAQPLGFNVCLVLGFRFLIRLNICSKV